jgi:hypothetical protein
VKVLLLGFVLSGVSAVAGSACMGDDTALIPGKKASSTVLELADLPAAFSQFDEGPIVRADVTPGPREDPARFDREGGWKARFRRPGTPETDGPIVVESRVDVFESSEGAEEDFDAYGSELTTVLEEAAGARSVDDPAIGDEAAAITIVQAALEDVRFYNIVWRHANVTASLIVQGYDGRLALEDALALARKQQTRIEAAATR